MGGDSRLRIAPLALVKSPRLGTLKSGLRKTSSVPVFSSLEDHQPGKAQIESGTPWRQAKTVTEALSPGRISPGMVVGPDSSNTMSKKANRRDTKPGRDAAGALLGN